MVYGAPVESRWLRPEPRRSLPPQILQKIVQLAFPHSSPFDVQPLTEGFRNANFRIQLNSTPEFVVLRIYEHDVTLCHKEVDLFSLIRDSVPIPEIIHAEPEGVDEIPPFVILRYVEGITFRELKRTGDAKAISEASCDAGRILASISRITFPKPGWLSPGLSVAAPLLEGPDPHPRFIDLCLSSANVRQRVKPELRESASALVWSFAKQFVNVDDETHLVHGDFGSRNVLVREIAGVWKVAAVLDWESAIAGSPLTDIGHFLRYETFSRPKCEPHFSNGYLQGGGRLPCGWRRWARILDMIALCESLTHDDLPGSVIAELIELVSAAVEDRNPQFSS